jgi:predicted TIM-barrel fold metal-dependent hydrolase
VTGTPSLDGGLPLIVSVDDHVVEPPDLWISRLPRRYHDRCPRVVRDRYAALEVTKARKELLKGGAYVRGDPGSSEWCDWWLYEDVEIPLAYGMVQAGFAHESEGDRRRGEARWGVVTFDEINPACWKQADRLKAMDFNHVEASVCFPNSLPRFCGQTFAESADKKLAQLCVQAYNDWMIDDWCGGDGRGRLIPLTIAPMWSAKLAAREIRRCADKGSHAVTFSENPSSLGLPSVHNVDRYWDPFFAACEETDTIINLHIGSSSVLPRTAPDSPLAVTSALTWQNACGSLLDYIFSGTLQRFPRLVLAYSEGQVGWMPFLLERADKLWEQRGGAGGDGLRSTRPA